MSRRQGRVPKGPFEIDIDDLARDGSGLGRRDGKTVSVSGGLPGEKVQFNYLRARGKRSVGIVEALTTRSPHRVDPPCRYFGRCGGCSFQHLHPHQQILRKQAWLLQDLKEFRDLEPARVFDPITGQNLHYRRKARLGVKDVAGKGRVLVGFRERHAPYITDMHDCQTLDSRLASLLDPLSELVGALSLRARIPQIDAAAGEYSTALCFRVLDPPTDRDLRHLIEFGRRWKVRIELQTGGIDSIEQLYPGDRALSYAIDGFDLELGFGTQDFVQVNGSVNSALVGRVLELLQPDRRCRVLDLYCGLGNFTLPLATRANTVTGVEGQAALVGSARRNAERNNIDNVSFHVHDLEQDAGESTWADSGYERVLLDPARPGAEHVLPMVAASGASRVVYVSCHPATLARDAGILVQQHGFRLEGVGVVDMFPHTAHVESIALFVR